MNFSTKVSGEKNEWIEVESFPPSLYSHIKAEEVGGAIIDLAQNAIIIQGIFLLKLKCEK